ncbi:MAG: phosphodiester glycosidase family protein [Oscillospiraceae bacterium]|nr:phosphodiester glycosidase family protein [Oscillospiraceae bacterium]
MKHPKAKQNIRTGLIAAASCILSGTMLLTLLHTNANPSSLKLSDTSEAFEQTVNNLLTTELGGNAQNIHYTRSLLDSDLIAPEPDPNCFGKAASPSEMAPILEIAANTLHITSPLFTVNTPIKEGTDIQYYLDDTIFAITWKQSVKNCTYTFSEVKIAHPSQFRRFFSEGKYNSGILHTTTEMAASVNAVTASSGDYYSYRPFGIVVNEGMVHRANGQLLDTCYIDQNGDLLFTYAREIDGKTEVQSYVDENKVRFSVSFGPVLLANGVNLVPFYYNSGEIAAQYPRAALCQMDALHYVVVSANQEAPDYILPTVHQFAENLAELGIPTAYALDGGQTASIVFNDQLINTVSYGAQREISDIIYFATAAGAEQ